MGGSETTANPSHVYRIAPCHYHVNLAYAKQVITDDSKQNKFHSQGIGKREQQRFNVIVWCSLTTITITGALSCIPGLGNSMVFSTGSARANPKRTLGRAYGKYAPPASTKFILVNTTRYTGVFFVGNALI